MSGGITVLSTDTWYEQSKNNENKLRQLTYLWNTHEWWKLMKITEHILCFQIHKPISRLLNSEISLWQRSSMS
jgi:hypothetical protein